MYDICSENECAREKKVTIETQMVTESDKTYKLNFNAFSNKNFSFDENSRHQCWLLERKEKIALDANEKPVINVHLIKITL